jgi:lipid-binding SYLF domain-containing protein
MIRTRHLFIVVLMSSLLLPTADLTASETGHSEPQKIVDAALSTLNNFTADPDMAGFRETARQAKAVLIVPQLIKAGLVVGGSGGSGVLLARSEKTNRWSHPAFFGMGSASIGAQIGAQASEVVLLVMTPQGLDSLLSTDIKLGADLSVAAGPVGTGKGAQTADVLSYARSKGAYAGLSVEGAVIKPRSKLNTAYYGKPYRPIGILIQDMASNSGADGLRSALQKAME